MMSEFQVWLILAIGFLVLASIGFVRSVLRKDPLWKSIKRWLVNIFDTLSGG